MKKNLFGISMITIASLYGLLAGLVILITLVFKGNVLYAIIGSIIVLLVQFLVSPWLTDLSMKWFYKAKFDKEIPDYLKKFIEEECEKYNIKYPKIGIIDDGAPNAFTYGRTKKDARIIITRGIFELLEEEEVKAVVAHEMGHIYHLDMMVMTFANLVPLVLYAIFEMFTRNNSGDSDNNKAAIVGYVAYVLYIICQYIILWLSRTREYYADEFSCSVTKNPHALCEALVKIGFGLSRGDSTVKHNVSKNNALGIFDTKASKSLAVSMMKDDGKIDKNNIKNAMKWEKWNPWAKWFEFNSTHPLISKRIEAINKVCRDYQQEEYIVFDYQKEEGYLGNFFVELLINFLPIIFAIPIVVFVYILIISSDKVYWKYIGLFTLLTLIFSFIKLKRSHRDGYMESCVKDLLGIVNVSHITSVPTIIKGKIIGRGNPGCIFNEDYVLQDETGIMFLDYNQPLNILNKIFAIFKSRENFDKEVIVKGWYRRSPTPYIEIKEYTIDGKTKKIHTYSIEVFLHILVSLIAIGLMIYSVM